MRLRGLVGEPRRGVAEGADTVTWPPSAGRRGHAAADNLVLPPNATLHDSGKLVLLLLPSAVPPLPLLLLLSNDGALPLGQVRLDQALLTRL